MAFLIPDNLKSRQDVPNVIRHVAGAFEAGLDEGCTAWYEPPYDPTGEMPHFVVLLPDRGIAVLEVLDIKAEKVLGVYRGRVRFLRDGREVEAANPLDRAEKLAMVLHDRIGREERLKDVTIPVGACAVLPYVSEEDFRDKKLESIIDRSHCLLREDIEAARTGEETRLIRVFAATLGSGGADAIPRDREKILRGLIQPDTIIDRARDNDQLVIFRSGEDGRDIVRVMDRMQETAAKSLGTGHRIIRGVAGSGKTLVLVYRAKVLARANPTKRFLLTCYTRSLAAQLRVLLGDYPNVEVIHLDGLMARILRAAKIPNPGYDEDDGGRVARAALEALSRVKSLRYAAVLLDEAQDFGTDALRFATQLLEPGSDDLVIVADAAQNIFRRSFKWRDAGIQAQGRTRILRTNYRNTREILEFACRFLMRDNTEHDDFEDENAIISPESALRSGPAPDLQVVDDLPSEVDHVILATKQFAARSSSPRCVAILYGTSSDAGENRGEMIRDGLQREGVNVFWLNDPSDKRARDRLAEAEYPVVLSTIHSAKGLEFPFVVLCGIWREGEDLDANRKLAYVGMTRATEQLIVIARRSHPLTADLERAQQDLAGAI